MREPLEADPTYVLKTGYTYSGHATACAAGLANLAIMEREGLLGEAERIGKRLGDGLRSIADDGLHRSRSRRRRGVGGRHCARARTR